MDVLKGSIDLAMLGLYDRFKHEDPIIEQTPEDSMSYLDRGSFRYIDDDAMSDFNCSVYTSTDVKIISRGFGQRTKKKGKKKGKKKKGIPLNQKVKAG